MKLFTVAAGLALVLVTTGSARAATRVWTGAAAPNTNWSNPSNWTGSAVPASGDDLVFPGTAPGQSNFNDLPATVVFNSLRFATGATGYVISSANELKLASGITVTNSTFSPIIVTPVRLVADQTFQTFDQILFLGSIALDGHQLIFDTTHSIDVGGIHLFSTNLPSVISGAGTIRKRGSGLLSLQQANTYTGVTIIEEGTIQLVLPGTLGSSANGTVLSNGATLQVFGGQTMSGPLELGGRLAFASPAPAVWPGPITLTSADATFDLPASTGLRVAGVVSGSGGLVKTNAGPLILEADDSYSGETRVQAGTLLISNSHLAGAVTLSSNTIFTASGLIGPLSSTGAQLSAGGLTSPGLLQVNGALTLDAATHFKVDINGTTPGITYDQVRVSGTVDLGEAQLVLSTTGEPALGSTFVIIRKDSPGPVAGTFAGLPQFATFTRGAFVWQIDYFGIDGNDVVLRVISPAFSGVVWDGGGKDTNWLTAENWLSDAAPSPEADLIFSNEATQRTNFNNFPPGTTFNSLRFTGAAPTTAFSLNGNPVALTAGIVADGSSGSSTLNLDLALAGGASLIADGTLFFNGTVSTSGGLNLSGAGTLVFGGPLRGTGGLTSSAGFVWLQTNNFYSGSTLVSTGTVRLDAERALGDLANVVQVESGATVQLDAATNVGNPMVLRGALQALGTNTWSGTIMVQGTNAALSTWFGPLTIAGAISGDGELAVDAPFFGAEVILSATNTFTGLTRLTTGLLLVNGLHAGGPLYVVTNAPFNPTTLGGTGTVGSVFASGTVAPGLTTTAGILTVAGSLTLSNTAVLDIPVGGTNEGVDFDQLRVSGGVLLDGPTLQLSFGAFSPPLGSTFTIIRNDSSSPVSGAFAGLAESAFFTNGPVFGRITYRGGDGNDVVLSIGSNLPPVVATNGCTPLPAGVVAWWRGDGNANDLAGTNNGTFQNGATLAPGLVGQAFSFNGVADFLSVPDSPAWDFVTNDFTIELWVQLHSIKKSMFIHQQSGTDAGGFEFDLQPQAGGLFFARDPTHATIIRAWLPDPGIWYHLAVTRAQDTYRFYVDGQQLGAEEADPTPLADVTGPLRIGDFSAEASYALDGLMDELTIYNRALAGGEVQAIFNAGSAGKCLSACAPPPSGLVSWWRAEGDANDFAGTNHGTLEGSGAYTNGIAGQGFLFNGAIGGVDLGNIPAFDFTPDSSFSMEAWFNTFGPSGGGNDGQAIVSLNYNCSPTLQSLVVANGSSTFGIVSFLMRDANDVMGFVSSPPVSANAFHHVAGVREVIGTNKTLRLYLDGALVGSTNDPTTAALAINAADWIGRRNTCGTDNVFNGIIDEVSVYNRALTSDEVAVLFNAGSAGKCTNSQNVSQTNVTVLLRDSNGAPIAAGLVTLGNRVAGRLGNVSDGTTNTLLFGETTPSPQGFTDTQGSFTFTNVPPSIGYRVTASKTGYAFQPVVSNLPPLIASQMVAFVGTSNILRTVSGRVTFTDGSPAANIPISVFAASADGSVRTIGISTHPDITDLDGRYSRTGLPAVASCFVSPRAPQLIISPRSQIVSLLDGDVTADFVATPKTWHISGVISPAAGAFLGADVPVLVVFGDPGAGTNAGNASTIVSAATRQGAYSSPPLTEGRSYLIQAMGPGLQFTPARRGVLPLVADVGGANFTFVPAPVNITGRVTNSSGFGLSAPHVIISGGISATQQVSVDGAYAFYNVLPGQTYILSASQTNFFFNPASALLPNLSLSRTQDFAGGPLLALLGRIAFVRNDDVVVMNADSSLLVTVPKVFADATPFERVALSPDGTKVAYAPASRFSFNRYPLIVEDVDGSNVRLLTGLDEVAVGSAWSPDGTQVATVIHASASRQAGIYLLSIDGSTAFRLPNSTGQERDPAWSPDGTKVAFDAYVNGGSNGILLSQIFVTGTNDASPPQSQVFGSQPAWSPDGTQIAFLSASRVMRVGSFPEVATTSHDAPGGGSAPAWSPDGAFLASSDLQTLPFQPAGVRVTSTNGTFETTLADGQFPSWSSAPGLATPPGGDVTVSNGIAAVTFSTVSTLGTTTIIPTPPPPVDTLPAGYVAIDGGPTLMNFEVTSTAEHSGPITLCFTLTNITNSVTFDSLRILHNESGLLVDRTLLPPDPQAPNFAAKTICARVDSLSPFALAQRVDPSLPLIAGLVADTDGNPVSGVAVSVSGGGGFPARTDTRGLFTIPNLTSGESYAVLPSDSHYDFNPPITLIENLAGTNLLAFIATPKIGPTLSITADGANPGQFTLSWQASSISYTLEFTGSLTAPDWGPVTVQPFIKDGYHSVTIEAVSAPLFFRLRQ